MKDLRARHFVPSRRSGFVSSALLAACLVLWPSAGQAESMDFALERLAANADECRTEDGFATGVECEPDHDAFLQLINQYGMALAPSSMYPARTTGYAGFELNVEATYTTINGDADYMKAGTRGPVDDSTGRGALQNESPASLLQSYSLRVRKGFGFGVETGLYFGFMPQTSIISGGADLRLALLEGFRSGIPGYIPDFAVTGSVRTITGTPQVQLTVVGVSGVLSKPITVADTSVITPWAGYQHLFIYGDSGVIDFTPAENALQACGYQGPNVPGNPGSDVNDGSPICEPGGSVRDFNNNKVFDPVRIMRQRLLFGLRYRYEVFTVGGQVMADVFASARKINGESDNAVFEAEKQAGGNVGNFAFSLQVGAQF